MSAAAKPEPFSSVILLRDAQPHGFEVLLTRRPSEGALCNGIHGFPCGPVQKSDHEEGIMRRCRGLSGETARKILGAHLSPSQALAFWIVAIRVVFEQVGILFAVGESGKPIAWDAKLDVWLHAKRAALGERRLTFRSILESENLFCDAASIRYFSHWQAEAQDTGDARIFLAAMPEEQQSSAASLDDTQWLPPERALQLFNRSELPMAFPTFASLRTLADFDDASSLLKEFQTPLAISKRAMATSGNGKSV